MFLLCRFIRPFYFPSPCSWFYSLLLLTLGLFLRPWVPFRLSSSLPRVLRFPVYPCFSSPENGCLLVPLKGLLLSLFTRGFFPIILSSLLLLPSEYPFSFLLCSHAFLLPLLGSSFFPSFPSRSLPSYPFSPPLRVCFFLVPLLRHSSLTYFFFCSPLKHLLFLLS